MEEPVVAIGMEAIIAATADVATLVGSTFDVITGNEYLLFFLAVSVTFTGFRIFSAARRTAH